MDRQEVYALIDAERSYQDVKYPVNANGVSASPEGFLHVLEALVEEAKAQYVIVPTPKETVTVMARIRKIGATAVRAMEQHGAPPR